jgi:AraC-like DNA-binding protein
MGERAVSITSVDKWRSRLTSTLTELDIAPKQDNAFSGRMRASLVGDCPLLTLRGPSLLAKHPESRANRTRTDRIVVIWQLAGRATARQLGEQLDIEAGDLAFLHIAEPYDVDCVTDFRQIVVSVPASDATLRRRVPSRPAKLTPRAAHEPWTAYLRSLATVAATLGQQERDAHRASVIDVVNRLRIRAYENASAAASPLADITALIREHAADPHLTPDHVAQSLAVSRRTFFRQLRASGTTYQQLVLDARLEHARDLLVQFPAEPVASVAQASGFRSRSHFHGAFRARFGESPGRYRAASS